MTPKDQLKKLFYSNLTAIELQRKLNINNKEYQKILQEVKKDLGLPSSYRRTPHRYGKYVKDSYFIKKHIDEDFEVLIYSPTLEDVENKLQLFDDGISVFEIDHATDERMSELIHEDYFNKNMSWDKILKKYQIPYHKFYQLLNKLKKEHGLTDITRSNSDERYVYKYHGNGKYMIRKTLNGKVKAFGYYPTVDIAVKVRDYLESIHWNIAKWQSEKEQVVEDIENGCKA